MKYISSLQNAKVKEWKKLNTKKGREKSKTFFIEGKHLIEEAFKHQIDIVEILVEEGKEDLLTTEMDQCPIYQLAASVMRVVSDTETPQGIAAVCTFLTTEEPDFLKGQWLLLDEVQDPGNLGTMIRTADSAGLSGVVLGKGSVDLYNPKVIRSTQGSLFHLPIFNGDLNDWVDQFKANKVKVYGTALENGVSYQEVEAGADFALILGNEGSGVSKELLGCTDQNLYIPIYGKAESLNVSVAAGILLYGLK